MEGEEDATGQRVPHNQGLSLADIGAWLSVIAAIGAPLYLMGLLVLAAQIAVTFEQDFATAWYAASLASNKTVFAVAIHFALNRAVQLFFLFALLQATIVGITNRVIPHGQPGTLRENWREVLPIFVPRSYIPDLKLFLLLVVPNALVLAGYAWVLWRFGWRVGVFLLLGTCSIRFINLVWEDDMRQARSLPIRLLRATGLYYVLFGTALLVLMGVQMGPPPLPHIELEANESGRIRGQLLSHSDGYWHILVEPSGDYMAIADGNAKAVLSPSRNRAGTPTPSATPGP